jgi:hypothetical protein
MALRHPVSISDVEGAPAAYESIDRLQGALAGRFFSRAADRKKAAGRALGTIVEILTYFVLREWGLIPWTAIEQRLPEYGNAEITHNVEFSLHPLIASIEVPFPEPVAENLQRTLTSTGLSKHSAEVRALVDDSDRVNTAILRGGVQRNCTVIAKDISSESFVTAQIEQLAAGPVIRVQRLHAKPFAMIECKRVGVEEGQKKGPTTIEKAKQGAYVASRVSSIQRVANGIGEPIAVVFAGDQITTHGPYAETLDRVIKEGTVDELLGVVLTIGVVSNHGNWFTGSNLNKELKVLRQSYDWLLFLKDDAITEFITDAIIEPLKGMEPVAAAFSTTYDYLPETKPKGSLFTKVTMDTHAYAAMCRYVSDRTTHIEEDWFEMLSEGRELGTLKTELKVLAQRVSKFHQ